MKKVDFSNRSVFTKNNLEDFQINTKNDMDTVMTLLVGNNSIPYPGVIVLNDTIYQYNFDFSNIENYHWEYEEGTAFIIKNKDEVFYNYLTKDTKIRKFKWADYINEFIVYESLLNIKSYSTIHTGLEIGELNINRNRNFITINGSFYITPEVISEKYHITQELDSSGKWIKIGVIENDLNIPSITSYTIGFGPNNINIIICIIGRTKFENTQTNHPRTPHNINEGDIYIYVGKVIENDNKNQLNYKFNFNSQIAL